MALGKALFFDPILSRDGTVSCASCHDLWSSGDDGEQFAAIYKEGITKESITDAIAKFEKTLITPDSPFDRYLRGEKNAISQKAKEGYMLFQQKGCIACHHGRNVGGKQFSI